VLEGFEIKYFPLKYPGGESVGPDVQSSEKLLSRTGVASASVTVPYSASKNHLQCGYTYTVGARRIFVKNSKVAFGSSYDSVDCQIVCATPAPTQSPTESPTKSPTESPTTSPTRIPTKFPTKSPTKSPTPPTRSPTKSPTKGPTPTGCVFTQPEISCGVGTLGATAAIPSNVYYPTSVDGIFDGESFYDNPYLAAGRLTVDGIFDGESFYDNPYLAAGRLNPPPPPPFPFLSSCLSRLHFYGSSGHL
jgi:hypothetical protein